MKISKSKQELASIISENGGWRDGVEFSAQDADGEVFHYRTKPTINKGSRVWHHRGCTGGVQFRSETLRNWHQTILSREEYFHLYPAPDADGWIEFDATERPSGYFNKMIDVKLHDGRVLTDSSWRFEWDTDGPSRIIAYRLHKQEQSKPEFCESVMRSIPEPEAKPTIEQMAADYRNAKDYAERKQQEANAAKGDADAKLKALKLAGEALGLVLSVTGPIVNCDRYAVSRFRNRDLGVPGKYVKSDIIIGAICDECGKSFAAHSGTLCNR